MAKYKKLLKIGGQKGLVSQILAILSEVPLGSYRIEMGLHLRQAMLINGIFITAKPGIASLKVMLKC